MTDFKQGDRVKVTYEADYFASTEGMIQVTVEGMNYYAPRAATLEVIRPEVKEPAAFGALVEVAGVKYVRADNDTYRWRGNDESWESWEDLERKGDIKILFDPDKPQAPQAEAHPNLRDYEGGIWRWRDGASGAGYYYTYGDGDELYRHSREAVDGSYGPVTEVA